MLKTWTLLASTSSDSEQKPWLIYRENGRVKDVILRHMNKEKVMWDFSFSTIQYNHGKTLFISALSQKNLEAISNIWKI